MFFECLVDILHGLDSGDDFIVGGLVFGFVDEGDVDDFQVVFDQFTDLYFDGGGGEEVIWFVALKKDIVFQFSGYIGKLGVDVEIEEERRMMPDYLGF